MPKKRVTKKKTSSAAGKPAKKPAPRRQIRKQDAASSHLADLERLIELMVEKEVVEVEFEEAGARWRVRRAEPHAVTYAAAAPMAVSMPSGTGAASAAPLPGGGEAAGEPQGEVFKSPMVGTFYRAGSPDAEPFSKPGDRVTSDRTLCIIEAMKVMNEIKAEREFEVLDVLVKNGESVEFGQPLFLIR